MGGILSLGHDLEVGIRMDVQVIVEGDIRIQGGINAARGQQLDGFLQGVDALHGGTVALSQLHVGGSQTVGSGLALQVLKGLDFVVVLADGQSGVDVTVGGGEIISQGALIGDLHAVADHVKASSVQTGEQAVPIALHILRLHAQLFGDGAGDLHVIAHQSVALVMVAPGLPCALQCHDQLATGLNGSQLVSRGIGSRGCTGACGGGGAAVGAAGQGQNAGSGHDTHHRNKSSALHS